LNITSLEPRGHLREIARRTVKTRRDLIQHINSGWIGHLWCGGVCGCVCVGGGERERERARILTVAAVLEIGPDDVFLREAEHSEPPASHGRVDGHAGVRHQLGALVESGSAEKK